LISQSRGLGDVYKRQVASYKGKLKIEISNTLTRISARAIINKGYPVYTQWTK
jgi:hypothetical protein